MTPREIVAELDRFIIGQNDAKKAVAIALRNRWRRQKISSDLREEVLPKNILMIGPTGVGKTEIARRLARLAQAPFIKVEATKFTEVGYVGRDVEQIIRDLVETSIHLIGEQKRKEVSSEAEKQAETRLLDALVGTSASSETRQKFYDMLHKGALEAETIEIEVAETKSSSMPMLDVPGMPGAQLGMLNLGDMLGKAFNKPKRKAKLTVEAARKLLVQEESEKLIDQDALVQEAISLVENHGIVFLDEFDKICRRAEQGEGGVSREGVQRDLLPLIEGTTVSTKHGAVRTDHILFISSGAFHVAKPSDLLPELQGRLPIRVEMSSLSKEDFVRILKEPEANLIKQYKALIATEGVELEITEDAIEAVAEIATSINHEIENIGARRLHALLEKVLEDISFNASEAEGASIKVDKSYVERMVGSLVRNKDLSQFIL